MNSVTILDGTATISKYAFLNCHALDSITIPASVTKIQDGALGYAKSLTHIYYGGSQEQWAAIEISAENDLPDSTTIHYNSTGE